jgi:hypothetical protein
LIPTKTLGRPGQNSYCLRSWRFYQAMRFLPEGPDIPDQLIAAQETGETIFVCGAGVSRTVGLPLFRGLVEGIYQKLGEDWNPHPAEYAGMQEDGRHFGQYDRVLRCLERRLGASESPRNRGMRERIRTAVRELLAPPNDADLANHLTLLKLSRDAEGCVRLVTTNFDTLFERAWFGEFHIPIDSHAGSAMPQPKAARCSGVLHLHGRLADRCSELGISSETDLVLTSAEFGDAYLRSGWASRYVYDLVRAYTVVLVGYQADDPPMRYLLEALEADRERFPDLQKVYAFAACEDGEEKLQRALWYAKAVEPILYTGDHSSLYDSLREWRHYADDPTAWRRKQLRAILMESPGSLPDARIRECVAFLSHGDASQLLAELSPNAEWLSVLGEKRLFGREGARPGKWIATRLNDPDMIRACAGLKFFDEQTHWEIEGAVERERQNLAPLRLRAWHLMLAAKRPPATSDMEFSWYQLAPRIKAGHVGFQARRLVAGMLRPRLRVAKAVFWRGEAPPPGEPEVLPQLLRLEFQPAELPPLGEILRAWPQTTDDEAALFRSVDRALLDALEEALDAGFLDGLDRTSWDVPSVAHHAQNAHRSGFYPIIRVLADLWHRIADRDGDLARTLARQWTDSHFLLIKRLWLFALAHHAFTPSEAGTSARKLDDDAFWSSGAQVELMRLLATRWMEFDPADRSEIEARLRQGIGRDQFPSDAFENEDRWLSIRDSSIFRRLKRIEAAGGVLATDSQNLLKEISARHQQWQAREGDRDDFSSWIEGGWGPMGHPELLETIADEGLVKEAARLQTEQHFEEGDIWRKFCSADPNRALQGLRLEASHGRWKPGAWRDFLGTSVDNGDRDLQFQLADLLLQMPDGVLQELLRPAAIWLQKRREVLSAANVPGGPRFLVLWDHLASLTYREQEPENIGAFGDDLLTQSLNSPGGILAWSLLDAVIATNPSAGVRLGPEFEPRFDIIVVAGGRPGLLGCVYLVWYLAYLDWVDPAWTEAKLTPLLSWEQPESLAMWRSYSQANHIGSSSLFNAIKLDMLKLFEENRLSDAEFNGLISKLLAIGLWRQRGQAHDYNLTNYEIKLALTGGPPAVRRNASWNLWRMMGDENGEPADKATRWRQIIGPFFREIWPLDAMLRCEQTTHNLVMMALDCEAGFPEAVEAIIDFVVPYQLYQISHSLRLDPKHDQLAREHPLAFVRLTNALINPAAYPVPSDLATLLRDCLCANPAIASDPAYIRLYGLRRQRGA